MTTVLNLLGGPSIGKSTLAAELYAAMKRRGLKVELVREVAKKWAYDNRQIGPFDQLAILGEQIKEESSLFNKVDYIVTDSPSILGSFYFEHNHKQKFATQMVQDYYNFAMDNGVEFIDYILPRTQKYEQNGRFENEIEARKIDQLLIDYIAFNGVGGLFTFEDTETNETMIEFIMENLE